MKPIIFFLFLTLILVSCDTSKKVGDDCRLLNPQKDGITKVEQKNLDCLTVNSDGLCLSYDGHDSYCTEKCGPERGCAAVECTLGDAEGNGVEKCVDSICYPEKEVCSAENVNGLCDRGTKCEAGHCVSSCEVGQVYIKGACHPNSELCSSTNLEGLCQTGTDCIEGKCTPVGCSEGYKCTAPINLLGHPFKDQYICIKLDDLSAACQNQDCSGHGKCNLVSGGGAECICDSGYTADNTALTCEKVIDPCEGIDCSGHGTCQNIGGNAECKCDDNYVQTTDKKDCIE